MKQGTILWLVAAAWAAAVLPVQAQSDVLQTAFVNVDAGAQPQRRTIVATNSFSLYDEMATVTDTQRIRNGMMFDVSGGIRIGHNLAAGIGYSQFGRAGTGAISASIPNPDFYDRPLVVASDATDLPHSERAIHGRVTYYFPVANGFDVSVSGGPSFIHVKQGLATNLTVAPGTQSVSLSSETQTGHAFGANAGIDGNVRVAQGVGIGLFVRYTYGKLDLPNVKDFKVGGVQGGLGLRLRF